VGSSRRSSSRHFKLPLQASPIPLEASDTALISAELLRRLHRGLLMCHLLEQRLAHKGLSSMQRRVHGGEGALVVGATMGLQGSDVVVTAGDSVLPHITHESPIPKLIRELQKPVASEAAIARQMEVALQACAEAKASGSVVLLLCTNNQFIFKAARLGSESAAERCPLIVLLHRGSDPLTEDGAPLIPVEAHDAVAIYRVTQEAIWRARRGGGPTVITAMSSQPTLPNHFESEALVHLREYMQRHGAWDEAAAARIRTKLEKDLEEGFTTCGLPVS
jgi:hypothetical protein